MSDKFEELLHAMPQVAEAVNHFKSEAVQEAAFQALLAAYRGDGVPKHRITKPAASKEPATTPETEQRKTTRRSTKRKRTTPTLVKDLDLRPKEQKSFKDFIDDKAPTNNYERQAVSIYYLEKILDLQSVTSDHVFTAFREAGWRIPSDFRNSLATTASHKGWIDSSDMENLTVTTSGINAVEHDLPKSSD